VALKLTRSLDEGRSDSKPASQGAAGEGGFKNAGLGTVDMLNDAMLVPYAKRYDAL
jgi:hypothetical protein